MNTGVQGLLVRRLKIFCLCSVSQFVYSYFEKIVWYYVYE